MFAKINAMQQQETKGLFDDSSSQDFNRLEKFQVVPEVQKNGDTVKVYFTLP